MFGHMKIGGHRTCIIVVTVLKYVNRNKRIFKLMSNFSLLFDIGCIVFWCCPCAMYKVYRRAGEDCLTCCCPMTLWLLRTKVRTLFRIRVSPCCFKVRSKLKVKRVFQSNRVLHVVIV